MRREIRHFYGHKWRTADRPAILKRAGGRFPGKEYAGGGRCEWEFKDTKKRCSYIDLFVGGRSQLDVAHIDGVPGHDDPGNLLALCRPCHKALDKERAEARARETRINTKDAKRPILKALYDFEVRGA